MQTTIIIPCYNEAKRLNCKAFSDFAQQNPEILFLFVNDGSKDETLSVLQKLAQQQSNLQYLDLKTNGGKAEAVRQGMLYAVKNSNSDYIGFWDADLATPLWEIPNFIHIISTKGFDIVTGLRLDRLGAHIKRKKMRHYLGRCFATTASMVLSVPVYDTQCGAKLYKASIVSSLFEQAFITKWLFDVEILARYIKQFGTAHTEKHVYEYPLWSWEDVGGSQLKAKDFLKGPHELLKIKRKYKL
jgi:glycosyltransferase involved in cell wall biosynthesis